MFAWCHTMSTFVVVALGATTTTEPPVCTLPASIEIIECALQTAGVREPEAMTTTLLKAELRTVSDVAELSAAETAELFDDMRAAAVPLGDRSRLRKVAWVHSVAWDRQQWGGPGEQSAIMFQSGSLPPSHKTIRDKTTNAHHRQLQSGGGVSIEVVAIAFTGLIGTVSYNHLTLPTTYPG